ncbi:hypothetical protein D3C74_286550 [compost metagenome]
MERDDLRGGLVELARGVRAERREGDSRGDGRVGGGDGGADDPERPGSDGDREAGSHDPGRPRVTQAGLVNHAHSVLLVPMALQGAGQTLGT